MSKQIENALDLLELPVGADVDSIRTSYKRLAMRCYPSEIDNATTNKKFCQLSQAYMKLTTDINSDKPVTTVEALDIYNSVFKGSFNGFMSSSCSSDDDEDDDITNHLLYKNVNTSPLYNLRNISSAPRKKEQINVITEKERLKNIQELLDEEEKEKRLRNNTKDNQKGSVVTDSSKAEKKRLKKKKQREKKRLEKTQDQETSPSNTNEMVNGITEHSQPVETTTKSKNTRRRDKKSAKEEAIDPTAAFVFTAVNKKKTTTNSSSNSKKNDKPNDDIQNETEDADILIMKSRKIAIKGNEMAQNGYFTQAIELFTEAIKLDPSDFRFFGNRSYCYDKINDFEKALHDANRAISLSVDWPKGYFRKGRALSGLSKFVEAETAFKHVLKLDKCCDDATHELQIVRVQQLMDMGFTSQQAESAIKQYETVRNAVDSLLAIQAEATNLSEGTTSEEETYDNAPLSHPTTQNIIHNTKKNNKHLISNSIQTQKTSNIKNPTNVQNGVHIPSPKNTMEKKKEKNMEDERTTNLPPQQTYKPHVEAKTNPKNPNGCRTLWVGNVGPTVTDRKLTSLFSKHGTITSVRCLPDRFCAFVNFTTAEGAGKAMTSLQGFECANQRLFIKYPDNPVQNDSYVPRANGARPVSPVLTTRPSAKVTGPVNDGECYFWRTTGCHYGDKCHYSHNPASKGIDRKPWQKT